MTQYIQTHYGNVWKNLKFLQKLINMCETCVQKTRSAVRIEGKLSSFFENKTGLKQGDSITNIIHLSITKSDIKYKNGS